MSQIRRTNQGGSIVLIIVVGVLLVLGLIGGIYLLKQRGEQARIDQAKVAANQQITADNDNAKKVAATVNTSNNTTSSSTNTNTASATTAAAATNKKEDLPVTGPESSAIELIGVGVITAFGASYLRSRRSLSRYL